MKLDREITAFPEAGSDYTYDIAPSESPAFISGEGQFHTDEPEARRRQPYEPITSDEILAMVTGPPAAPKEKGRWFIPSTLMTRNHARQREGGQFFYLWVDLDELESDGVTFNEVARKLAGLEFSYWAYTTRSATEANQKTRILVPLAELVDGPTWVMLQTILNNKLEELGLTPDRVNQRPGQLCYLPNKGEFWRYRISETDPKLEPGRWGTELAALRAAENEKKASRKAQHISALEKAQRRLQQCVESPVDAFNECYSLGLLFDRYGYLLRKDNKWLSPNSSSKVPGVKIHPDNPRRWISHHASDESIGRQSEAGCTTGDAFDLFRHYECPGLTQKQAVRKVAELLGIEHSRADDFVELDEKPTTSNEKEQWPEPQPLIAETVSEPYPLDALPDPIREAVKEVQGFVQAPVAMVATGALAAVSLAGQALADVTRAEKLEGPCGLFSLVIADSGERKSTCDGFFMEAIRDYEKTEADAAEPDLKQYQAEQQAWQSRVSGINDCIRSLSKQGKDTRGKQAELAEVIKDKPEPPRIPRLCYADATPEALKWSLAKQWPSAGIISSEAGVFFGSHGMSKDSAMRNMATLNQLWDGDPIHTDRRGSESFVVRGARLTAALQVQEPVLRDYVEKSGSLARGSGFLARFLVAWPESRQGFRPFSEPPKAWPGLRRFNGRLGRILRSGVPITKSGELEPPKIPFARDAKESWIAFHDEVEINLRTGREYSEAKDVAAKAADNLARLALLFRMFNGDEGAITLDSVERAGRVVRWHLRESLRFFGELALPEELADAARLDSWLVQYCRSNGLDSTPRREVQQLVVPVRLRKGKTLENALEVLTEAGRVRLEEIGRKKVIRVNPRVLEEDI